MLCKYQLNINGLVHDIGNECIKNWDEVSFAIKRSDFGGVLRSFSSSFQFVGQAYKLLFDEYQASYLQSRAAITIYTLDNNLKYRRLYSARLDFGSLEISNGVLQINSFDDSVASMLNAKKSTQYEYNVAELKEQQPLRYDRLQMSSETHWIDGGTLDETQTDVSFIDIEKDYDGKDVRMFPLSILSNEIALHNTAVPNDVLEFEKKKPNEIIPFFEALSDIEIDLDFSFDAWLETYDMRKTEIIIQGIIRSNDMKETVFFANRLTDARSTCTCQKRIRLRKNEKMYMYFAIRYTEKNKVFLSNFNDFSIKFNAIGSTEDIDVIKPSTLLNRLLTSICTGVNVTGTIESADERLLNSQIIAAESARGIKDAKIYTSYKKFCDWMSTVYGYVPVINGNNVTFVHRDTLFTDKAPVVCENVNEVSMNVDEGRIYSSVKVGYEKKDYDSVNGRDEFRWTNEFETGVDIKSSTLQLISPYRADAYGIEFLVAKRGEDTSDTDSDTDVFFVLATLAAGGYQLVRTQTITGVLSPETMYNVMFSPRSIIKANERFIACSTDMLRYASTTGNSDIMIDGEAEKANYVLQNRLFTIAELNFKSASNIEASTDSPISVISNGKIYTGYVDEKKVKYGRYEGAKYKLLIKTIK